MIAKLSYSSGQLYAAQISGSRKCWCFIIPYYLPYDLIPSHSRTFLTLRLSQDPVKFDFKAEVHSTSGSWYYHDVRITNGVASDFLVLTADNGAVLLHVFTCTVFHLSPLESEIVSVKTCTCKL